MSYFSNASVRGFGEVASCILASKGRLSSAVDHAELGKASVDVRRALKSIGLLSEIAGTPFYQDEARTFLETMRGFSAFDQLAAMAQRVPMRRRVATLAAVIDGDGPDETAAKLLSPFDIPDDQLQALKAVALIAQSAELAAALTETGINFLLDQLRNALGPATDERFFQAVLNGVAASPATGTDAEAFRYDVAAALKRLGLGQNSRPAIVVDADQALALAFMEDASGGLAFPDMTATGGEISGVPVLVSDGVPPDDASPAGRQVIVLDAQGLGVDPGEIVLTPAAEAVLTIDGQDYSLWQRNLVALRAERWFGAAVARAGAVQVISGAAYAPAETSP